MNKEYKDIIIFGSDSTCKDELTEKITQELPYKTLNAQIKFDDFKQPYAKKDKYRASLGRCAIEEFLVNYYMRLLSKKDNEFGYVINDLDMYIFTKYCLDCNSLIYCLGNISTNSIDLAVNLKEEEHPSIKEMNDLEIINYARKEILLAKKQKIVCAKYNIPFYDVANDKQMVLNHITHDISENYEIKRSLSK